MLFRSVSQSRYKMEKELILASNKNDAIFIYRYLGDMSGRDEEYFKSFDQKLHAFHIRFFNPSSSREGAVYLEESAARQNIQIDKDALIELVELKSLDLQEAAKELEKLSMLGTKITVQDIKKYVDGCYRDWETDRKSTRLNSSHITRSRMPSSA